ncbi:YidC/Oxa1 family membrane protein insertase [Helicobacter sp. 23-1046]
MLIDILYYTFIFPLQSVLGFALDSLHSLTHNYGLSIILLSLLVNLFLLKLAKIAESKATKINALKSVCDKKIAEFKRVFKGAELQSYIRTLYKQKHYHPIFALSALGGLALQVPFFIAVLCLLQEFDGIKGVSFLWIADLSAPDSVLGVHLLPILMTIISLANVWIVAKERGAKIQGVLISLIFLVLLYQMPSALVLYWTTNMAFSLLRAIWGKIALNRHTERSEVSQTKIKNKDISPTAQYNKDLDSSLTASDQNNKWGFFIHHKPFKIAIIALSSILAIGLCLTFALMLYTKDRIYTASITLDDYNKARIHFNKLDFLARSSSISKVELVGVEWDKSINSSTINITHNVGRFAFFEPYLVLEQDINLGQISYTIHFIPLLKNIFKYYFGIFGFMLGFYLLLCVIARFQAYSESYAQIYRAISIYATLCIAFLICVFTPYQLYSTDITQFDSSQTIATLSALFGAFLLISFIVIYALSFVPKRFSNIIAFVLSVILFSGLVYSFILVGDYGAMDRFILQIAPQKSTGQIFECITVLSLGIAIMAFALTRLKRALQIIFVTLFIVSGVNAVQITTKRFESTQIAQETNQSDKNKPPFADSPLFSYSKNDKNIVVIVLDMFSGSHMPYILEQFPEFRTKLDGFTLFPNAISTTDATIHSISTLISGEYYAVYNMNQRKQNLRQSIDKAYIDTSDAFAKNKFSVGLMIEAGTNISNITKQVEGIFAIPAWGDDFTDYYIHNSGEIHLGSIVKTKQHIINDDLIHFFNFGIFRFAPKTFRTKIYKEGYWFLPTNLNVANTILSIKSTSPNYVLAHTINANSTKPTFKFLHTLMTHFPCVMYFDGKKIDFFKNKSAWNDYPHKAIMPKIATIGQSFYQHYDAEVYALKYLADYIENLKKLGIYDNTQIFVVSDHAGEDSIGIPKLPNKSSNRWMDTLLLFKDFGTSGKLKIDSRLMANYDIASIFCENLPNGCPNVPPNILKNYPTNREIISTIPISFDLKQHKENEWLLEKAYKVRGNIYDEKNWIDISDESYGIVNVKNN